MFLCFGSVMETLIALINLMRLTALRSKYRNVTHDITRLSFLFGNYSKLIGSVTLLVYVSIIASTEVSRVSSVGSNIV